MMSYRSKTMMTVASTVAVGLLAFPFVQSAQADTTSREDAVAVLKTLTVTPTQADVDGYSQSSFDYPKKRPDLGSKADQWDAIYRRDFDPKTIQISADGDVQYGELKNDPYSGQTITYHKGDKSSVDIEHVVARSEAWDSGASKWTQEQRDAFANDPLELIAVDSSMNRSHGEKDAAEWLPSKGNGLFPKGNPSYDCLYVARQIAVKAKYKLTVDKAEHDAMAKTLSTCPGQTLPVESDGAWWDSPDTSADDSLKKVIATLDGKPIEGFDPTRNGGWAVDGDPHEVRVNIPTGWTPSVRIEPTAPYIEFQPYQSITLTKNGRSVTWTFTARNTSTSLKDVKVTEQGVPVSGLDASRSLYHADRPEALKLSGLPSLWTATAGLKDNRLTYVIRDANRKTVATWTFTGKPVHTITVNGIGSIQRLYIEDGGNTASQLGTPTRTGYEFTGWAIAGNPYDPAKSVTSDLTITANWKRIATDTDDNQTDNQTVTPPTDSQTITSPTEDQPTDDTKTGETDGDDMIRTSMKNDGRPALIATTGSSIVAVVVGMLMLIAAALGVIAVRQHNGKGRE